ncbi:MAG: alpha/beta fold hydrolase [Solirubrobacteraceae bacterium]
MELAHHRVGHGPPLVLLHPLGADRRVWDPLAAHLSAQRELIALDLPGFGESPPLSVAEPTPRALAGAVASTLAELGVDRPHVAGNSLGGWVALELGMLGVARTVTAIAPAGLWPQPLVPKAAAAHRVSRALLALVGPAAATGAGRRLLLSGSVAHPERVPAAEAAHLVRSYALAPGFVAVNNAMRAGRFAGLERICCPVTLVWPDHDRLIERPVWVPNRIANVVLSDSGHIPMWDSPAALARVLIDASGGEADPAAPPARIRAG